MGFGKFLLCYASMVAVFAATLIIWLGDMVWLNALLVPAAVGAAVVAVGAWNELHLE